MTDLQPVSAKREPHRKGRPSGTQPRMGLTNNGHPLTIARSTRRRRVIDDSDAAPRFVADGFDGSPDESDLQIPVAQRKTLMQLTERTCRWPVGHPRSEGFFFCGGETITDSPYCAHHTRRASAGIPVRRGRRFALQKLT